MTTTRRQLPNTAELIQQTCWQLQHHLLHDSDFSILRRFLRPETDVLDIGANRGQSIVSFFVLGAPRIHSFEANPQLYPTLHSIAQQCDGAIVHQHGLSDENGTFTLWVPWSGATCYLEEASVRPDYFELPWVKAKFVERGGLELEPVMVEVRVGDELNLRPSVIKVDVEGAECRVLKGLAHTIEHHRPVVLVENSDYQNVTDFLDQMNYVPHRVMENRIVPMYGECTNTLYLPAEIAVQLVQ